MLLCPSQSVLRVAAVQTRRKGCALQFYVSATCRSRHVHLVFLTVLHTTPDRLDLRSCLQRLQMTRQQTRSATRADGCHTGCGVVASVWDCQCGYDQGVNCGSSDVVGYVHRWPLCNMALPKKDSCVRREIARIDPRSMVNSGNEFRLG